MIKRRILSRKKTLSGQALVWLILLSCLASFCGGKTVLCRNHHGEVSVATTAGGEHCLERHLPACHSHDQKNEKTDQLAAAPAMSRHHNFCDDRELALQLHAPRRFEQRPAGGPAVATAGRKTMIDFTRFYHQAASLQLPPGNLLHPHIRSTILLI
ncbi:MAG: hypothetical protein JXR89_03890 [Deltaproteobacteria bacterium]|nr:hypothetical protein [Deltaproteobacteria bacterium]